MLNDQIPSTSHSREHNNDYYDEGDTEIREIHALTPPHHPHPRQQLHSHQSSLVSVANTELASSENFTSISREFSALVLAGSSIDHNNISPLMSNITNYNNEREGNNSRRSFNNFLRIREDELMEETNPLAIVADNNPLEMVPSTSSSSGTINGHHQSEVSVQRVKKEEVESKIAAWQNAKVAKVNNRFKREDAVINGWENEQVQKANSWLKKVEERGPIIQSSTARGSWRRKEQKHWRKCKMM
ncbi:remorin 4.2-like isoform X2 [Trifolium pratense]|uniref:remorin 4.2-like isoform X2 n=1 Tax=Trifolium pratense TaxID=57577 RepID=UPI001E696452|nr:remorin 4.2-like isoform X2 [Trifolium pratense]